jgi:dolichol-phosphate mannosyltransferase
MTARVSKPEQRVFISLPVLNEVENILPLLEGIDRSLAGRPYLVCVIDDGSRDGTVELLQLRQTQAPDTLQVMYRTKTRRGSQRGGALLAGLEWGLEHTDCDVFVEMDGDLSHRPEELLSAIELVRSGECDVVIASKFVPGSRITNRPLGRKFVSRACSAAVWVLLSREVKDYSNGFRFYTRGAAETVRRTRMRYTSPIYLSEVLAVWLRSGLKVREIPTIYIGRNEGLSKLRLIDLAKAALAVFEISTRYHLRGFRAAPEASKGSASHEGKVSVEG